MHTVPVSPIKEATNPGRNCTNLPGIVTIKIQVKSTLGATPTGGNPLKHLIGKKLRGGIAPKSLDALFTNSSTLTRNPGIVAKERNG